MTCPACKGKPRQGIANCSGCYGSGSVSDEHGAAMEQGDKARRDRISVDLSLREAAKILGVMPAIMSDFEWGRLVVGRMANLSERTHALYITHGLKE